jgi:hypothetical protein
VADQVARLWTLCVSALVPIYLNCIMLH